MTPAAAPTEQALETPEAPPSEDAPPPVAAPTTDVPEIAASALDPAPPEAPTAPPPPPMDISYIPADPAEDDISPAGPSLAARMRRLAARGPQGSPAQMRALGDRLQELSGRMKRDAPRRGMQ